MIDFIAKVMGGVLAGLADITHSYGLALVLFALVVKTLLLRPTLQMYKSQKDMEKIKPRMEAIKKKYPDDMQAQQTEMVAMYKELGVNPMAGCLPMLIQMPILFGIWRAITSNPEVFRSSYFLWVHPGSLQSQYPLYFASSLADPDFLLVLIYAAMMVMSQQFTPSSGDPSQKQIGLFMSLFFSMMVWKMKWPCALVLYWSAFQFIGMLQQIWISKHLNRTVKPVA